MLPPNTGEPMSVRFRVVERNGKWEVVVGLGRGDLVTRCNTKEEAEGYARRMNGCFSVLEVR